MLCVYNKLYYKPIPEGVRGGSKIITTMKKLFIFTIVALGMLACSEGGKNAPEPEKKEGALPGKFTVSANTKVQFSQGNLQYQASSNTWRFAEHQYDMIGTDNANASASYSGWIDLFFWGTGNNPLSTQTNVFTDWGTNAVLNGGNTPNQWRTLTADEWLYLFHGRNNAEKLIALGTVNNIPGTIILPDDWKTPSNLTFYSITEKGLNWGHKDEMGGDGYFLEDQVTHFLDNTYTISEWSKMEESGAVFLPAAGQKVYAEAYGVMEYGMYWSSTPADGNEAFCQWFYSTSYASTGIIPKGSCFPCALSVRLVQDIQ